MHGKTFWCKGFGNTHVYNWQPSPYTWLVVPWLFSLLTPVCGLKPVWRTNQQYWGHVTMVTFDHISFQHTLMDSRHFITCVVKITGAYKFFKWNKDTSYSEMNFEISKLKDHLGEHGAKGSREVCKKQWNGNADAFFLAFGNLYLSIFKMNWQGVIQRWI